MSSVSSRCCLPVLLAMLVLVAPLVAGDRTDGEPETPVVRIDLNASSAEELTAVPGIGETMAARIVEFRDKHGPFRRPEDLLKIKGIGDKSFEKLRPYVKVERSS